MNVENNKKILLVEDEAIIALVQKKILEKNGFTVIQASSGEKALEIVNSAERIDLILMDINLGPGIDGTAAAELILKTHSIPLLFLTSHTEPEIVEKTEGISSYGFIVKNSGETVLLMSIKMAFRLYDAHLDIDEKNQAFAAANEELEAANEEFLLSEEELFHKAKALRESEERFRSLFNLVPDLISIHDSEMNILYSNWQGFGNVPEHKRLLNSRCYYVYRGCSDICPDCLMKEAMNSGKEVRGTIQVNDGRWLDIRVIPLPDDNNGGLFMEWVRDITETKYSDDLLRESEALLKNVIDSIPLSLTIVTLEGEPLYVNPQALTLFEADAEETLKNLSASFVWENPEDRIKWIEALQDQGVVKNYEANIITLSGRKKYLLLSGLIITYREKRCVLSIHIDITDRKMADIALRESEEKYRLLFQNSPLGIYIADRKGNILDANDRLIDLLGSPSLEATREINVLNFPLLVKSGYGDIFKESVEKNIISSLEFEYTSKWGKSVNVSNYLVPVTDSAGMVDKVFTLIEDITLRKDNEKKVENLLKEKELLLIETHHRIKNNMNTVYGLLYMQAEEQDDPLCGNILKDAASRIQSMIVLYDKLYRSEDHHEMNVNHYLPQLINEIISLFDSPVPLKTEINVEDIVLSAKILSSIGIIINELITNSMKYAFGSCSEAVISISLAGQDNGVVIVYKDNGAGLPDTMNFENSAGFGMQLIYMLVQQIGGTIDIIRGGGAQFVIRFWI